MSVFNSYARYYDLLYKDKDYEAEGTYVHKLIQHYAPGANLILDLGCGTGAHAKVLAEKGYTLHGVDSSSEMLESATRRLSDLNRDLATKLSFSQGDIRTVRIDTKYDVVLALFHVMSYQTTNDDLMASFSTVRHHLRRGGIFIFDCWYGPAVLSEKPAVRVKQLEDERIFVHRIAEPVMHPGKNTVDVNYQVIIKDKLNMHVEELREVHRMRYLFNPEIELFSSMHELKLLDNFEWMSGKEPGFDTWGVCFVVQA